VEKGEGMGHAFKSSTNAEGHNDPATFMAAVRGIAGFCVVRRDFDIPYLAGCSTSGWVVYIDRHYPSTWQYRGVSYDTALPLIVHEWVEFMIEQKGGIIRDDYLSHMYQSTGDPKWKKGSTDTFDYALSHQLAQHLEKATVIDMVLGTDVDSSDTTTVWNDYTEFCDQWIKTATSEKIVSCPADLFLLPYEDDGADLDLLRKMAAAGAPVSYLLLDVGQIGGSDGRPFYEGG
jgi:hypothetical protein